MFSMKAILLLTFAVGSFAAPAGSTNMANSIMRRSTANSEGMNNGFFYSVWSDGTGNVQYTNGDAGHYDLTWSNAGDVVVGKGFQTGAARNINYQADYQPQGISFLAIYGWMKDPLTEYYICENYGSGSPAGGDGMIKKGSFESDGSTYDVYVHQQVNAPSIQGTTNFMQYWSIRQDKRTSGTVNTGAHFDYWKSLGLTMGTFHYQILATEGVKSSGKSSVTVSEGGDAAAPAPAQSSAAAAPAPSSAAAPSYVPSSAPAPVQSSVAAPSSVVAPPSSVAVAPPSSYTGRRHRHTASSAPASPTSVSAAAVAPSQAPVAAPAPSPSSPPTYVAPEDSGDAAVTTVIVTQVVTATAYARM